MAVRGPGRPCVARDRPAPVQTVETRSNTPAKASPDARIAWRSVGGTRKELEGDLGGTEEVARAVAKPDCISRRSFERELLDLDLQRARNDGLLL
jgi:hypothetical protein